MPVIIPCLPSILHWCEKRVADLVCGLAALVCEVERVDAVRTARSESNLLAGWDSRTD